MNSKNKIQEIKSSDEKAVNKKLLRDLYKNEKRLESKLENRDKRIKSQKENIKELKVENKMLLERIDELEDNIRNLNKLLDESHDEITLLKIDTRLEDKASEKLKSSRKENVLLKKENESKIVDLNLKIISLKNDLNESMEDNKIKDEEIDQLQKELKLSNKRIEELYCELLNDTGDYDFYFKLETCPKCGAVVGNDSNYCVECGSKLD